MGLKVIDLGAGHASASETLCGRVIAAMKAEALLNETVGAGYISRNWPPAFKDSGAWPLGSLRQSFLNGALTRLLDPDRVLRAKIVEFVGAKEPEPTGPSTTPVRVAGQLTPELWNRLGTKVLPKLRTQPDFAIEVAMSATVDSAAANDLKSDLKQIIADLGLEETLKVT